MIQLINGFAPAADISAAKSRYARDGFVQGPKMLADTEVARVNMAFDALIRGEWETGIAPRDAWWQDGDDPSKKLRKIDQPHLANRTIHRAICHSNVARWAAGVVDAARLQVFAVQLLHKPPGGDPSARIGWHHDYRYWGSWFQPGTCEAFTIWIALTCVGSNSGPMCFVRGSHHWKLGAGGDFDDEFDGCERDRYRLPAGAEWEEVPDLLPAGAFSLHHQFLFHGSRPNTSDAPRRCLAVHVCTEKAVPNPGVHREYDYAAKMADLTECPIIYNNE